jgi:sugar-specific transcriptional regulator TrmB
MADRFRQQIRQFGLTEKEADTYQTILESGPATVTEIANEVDVSKRYIYTVAKELEERHFVIVNDYFTPTTIEAASPDEVYENLSDQLTELYGGLKERYQGGEISNDTKVLKSRSTVINKIDELISGAEKQIGLCLPAVVIPTLEETLRDAVDRGVFVLLLVFEDPNQTATDPLDDIVLEGIAHAIRYRDTNLPVLVSVDNSSALVASRGVITQPDSSANALFLGQPYMETVVFSSFNNSLWVNSEEVHVTSPHDLPHTYKNIRRAAIDAVLHREAGRELFAEIEARQTDRPESVVNIRGEVAGVKQRHINPTTDARPRQCCLCIQADDETITIGNPNAFLEDYRAYKTTLYPISSAPDGEKIR